MHSEIHQARSFNEIKIIAAELICAVANQCVESHGSFSLVLAGGNTPRQLYELLTTQPFSDKMPWRSMHLFWGDERWVAAEHPDSNFNMAAKSLLAHIDIPEVNIHQIRTDLPSPKAAARKKAGNANIVYLVQYIEFENKETRKRTTIGIENQSNKSMLLLSLRSSDLFFLIKNKHPIDKVNINKSGREPEYSIKEFSNGSRPGLSSQYGLAVTSANLFPIHI